MASGSTTSRAFKVFAIGMVAALVLGTLVVFGGSIFDSNVTQEAVPVDEAQRQKSELETRVADEPEDADSAAILASIYTSQGNIADAVPLYERATSARPEDGNLRLAFGIALYRGGSLLDAQVQLERALDLLPESPSPAYYLGQVEEAQADPDLEAARNWYERAIATDPNSVVATQAEERLLELDAVVATPTE